MVLTTLKGEQSFDTLRLQVPADIFSGTDWNKFSIPTKHNASTLALVDDTISQVLLDTGKKIKGLNTFTYVPDYDRYDLQISAKILGEDYYKGITKETIIKVGETLIENGIVKDVDMSEFIFRSKVLRADNTFNILVNDENMNEYYDALSLVITQGTKGKIDVYGDDGKRGDKVNGIVVGKDTKVLQKITIYDKMEEARVKLKLSDKNFNQLVKMEYGMDGEKFREYFTKRLRIELRVSDFHKLRGFYTDRKRGDVFLNDLLFSENNAILYQWNQFVSRKDSAEAIKHLDMSLQDKQNYRLGSYSAHANWALLKPFVEKFKGDEKIVTDKIKKLHYYDDVKGTYKKLSESVRKDIVRFCSEYKQNKMKELRGELFTSSLTEKYKEIDKKIMKL